MRAGKNLMPKNLTTRKFCGCQAAPGAEETPVPEAGGQMGRGFLGCDRPYPTEASMHHHVGPQRRGHSCSGVWCWCLCAGAGVCVCAGAVCVCWCVLVLVLCSVYALVFGVSMERCLLASEGKRCCLNYRMTEVWVWGDVGRCGGMWGSWEWPTGCASQAGTERRSR